MRLISVIIILLVGTTACYGDLVGPCHDEVTADVTSPGRRYVATVFERDCGATVDYSTHVALRNVGAPFDSEEPARIVTVAGRTPVRVSWTTDLALTVELPKAETFKRAEGWQDVRVSYR